MTVSVVRQDTDGDLPDAYAEPEPLRDVDTDALSVAETAKVFETFQSIYPDLDRLTGGERVPVEAEHETSTKPGQTVRNLAQAVEDAGQCLFVARPDAARRVDGALSDPAFVADRDDEGNRTFYNRRYLRINGEQVYRTGGKSTVWREDGDGIVLADSDGNEHARFDSVDAIFNDADAYPATESDIDGDSGDWRPIKQPVVPERAFDGEIPTPDAWEIVVLDDDGSLSLRGGELVSDTNPGAAPAVSDGAASLLDLLRDQDADSVTTTEADNLAGDTLDISRRTVGNYLDELADAGVAEKDTSGRSNQYHIMET